MLADEQLAARDWWEREGDVGLPRSAVQVLGHPVGAARPGARHRRPVGRDAAGGRRGAVAGDGYDESAGPLRGLRIIEVTTNWAGPVAGRFLADLGADSVKIEWATRPATRALFWVGPNGRTCSARPTTGRCTSTR